MAKADKIVDVGSTADVKEQKIETKRKDKEEQHRLETVLKTYNGRAVLWKVLEVCRVFEGGFVNPEYSTFRDGSRTVGLTLIDEIEKISPKYMSQMSLEAKRRKTDAG